MAFDTAASGGTSGTTQTQAAQNALSTINGVSQAVIDLQKQLGQSVVVENRAGGGGGIGMTAIARSAPDGYTIGLITVEITMMHHQGLTELNPTSYTPLALMNVDPPGVQVNSGSPYKTIKALADAAREGGLEF